MADDQNAGSGDGKGTNQEPDLVKNMKAEFDRKFTKLSTDLASSQQQLIQQLQGILPKKPAKVEDDADEDDFVLNPKAAKEKLTQQISNRIEEKFNQQLSARDENQRIANQTLASLVSEYPELNDPSNELTTTARGLYEALTPQEQANPRVYKQVVYEAAAQLGARPKSKRAAGDDDDFTIRGQSQRTRTKNSSDKSREKLDPDTIEFARLMGRPVDDPKYIEKLKQHTRETPSEWIRYKA